MESSVREFGESSLEGEEGRWGNGGGEDLNFDIRMRGKVKIASHSCFLLIAESSSLLFRICIDLC